MVYSFRDLFSFEEWFTQKLIEEKSRRINYIKRVWDELTPKNRENLLKHINNNFLLPFIIHIIIKNYDELYFVIKECIESSFEKIEEWKKKKL